MTASESNCGPEMLWVLKVHNGSDKPFTVDLDRASITQTDDQGNSNTLMSSCGPWQGIDGLLAEPTTVQPDKSDKGIIIFKTVGIPASSKYLFLRLKISGRDLAFRYSLR